MFKDNLNKFEITIEKNQKICNGLENKEIKLSEQEKKFEKIQLNKEIGENSEKMENTFINKKRGRKNKKEDNCIKKGIIHDKLSDDNLNRKVKTHFHIFIIAFLNMKLKNYLNKRYRFGKISSEITQNITVEFNQKLFDEKIKDILIRISDKFKDKDKNKIILQILMNRVNENDEIVHLLNMTYKDMYNNYYLKSNKETFKAESFDESYEAHLRKLENLYGKNYVENYKRNAQELITFFYRIKKRVRKKKFKGLIIPQLVNISNNENINYNYLFYIKQNEILKSFNNQKNDYIDLNNKINNSMKYSKKFVSTSTQTDTNTSEDEDEL